MHIIILSFAFYFLCLINFWLRIHGINVVADFASFQVLLDFFKGFRPWILLFTLFFCFSFSFWFLNFSFNLLFGTLDLMLFLKFNQTFRVNNSFNNLYPVQTFICVFRFSWWGYFFFFWFSWLFMFFFFFILAPWTFHFSATLILSRIHVSFFHRTKLGCWLFRMMSFVKSEFFPLIREKSWINFECLNRNTWTSRSNAVNFLFWCFLHISNIIFWSDKYDIYYLCSNLL